MEMKKCGRGHYYDASIHTECPYCMNESNVGTTMALGMPPVAGDSKTVPMTDASKANVTRPLFAAIQEPDDDDSRTIALIQKDLGIDPVVGWLICIDGKEKGRDYRIHSENNFVGRSEKMDICIRGDETISRENQAVITYDTVGKSYYLSPGDGRSIVRVNDKAIFQTEKIKAYDRIMIGKTGLLFLPLCGDNFEWEKE